MNKRKKKKDNKSKYWEPRKKRHVGKHLKYLGKVSIW